MATVTIQIGNSDNKLTQQEWADFVSTMKGDVLASGVTVHFFGGSPTWERWQNAAWVVDGSDVGLARLKLWVQERCGQFRQESVAWTQGVTEMVPALPTDAGGGK